MPDDASAPREIRDVLAEAGRFLQAAGDDLSEHVGFVSVAQALQSAGEALAAARAGDPE